MNERPHLVPRNFILFDDYLACIQLIAIIALARHPRAALTAKLFVARMVFADPPNAKTNGTVFIHILS
jgi:hypothetical protein